MWAPQPLQYYWSRGAVKLYHNMLGMKSIYVCLVMQANLKLQSKDDSAGQRSQFNPSKGDPVFDAIQAS
eukprot:1161028-Pelagomonas_calceolata.AAC.7